MKTAIALLRLARVSNLPTVWSNVLGASVIAGGLGAWDLATVIVAMSAFYTGGMMLNDAFDRDADAAERPERPLPSGDFSPAAAWTLGFALLGLGVALLAIFGLASAVAGLALAAAILLYDAWHKGNPLSPVIMGACRALVYAGTALAAGATLSPPVIGAALALLLYVAGITLAAKGSASRSASALWPAVLLTAPIVVALLQGQATTETILISAMAASGIAWAVAKLRSGTAAGREAAVGLMIALIAIMDAVVASAHGDVGMALVAGILFILTLVLQRFIAGT
ncbi:UbiA family prenyltransferase [Hyphomicrobium sp.]|uniref:UbiA family prenyltransferase n=1 Tax=Hyphomicrobium sp. TaxID=82 RepID=UPI002FDCFE87